MKRRKPATLRPVHPNAGIRAKYRKQLLALVEEMADSYAFWIERAYGRAPPLIAQDASPRMSSKELERELAKLGKRWQDRFDEMAGRLGKWFATAVDKRSQRALMEIMKRAGWTVSLKITPVLRDVIHASVVENVGLIKSIPEQFHTQVQGYVMRSVTAGRDLSSLNKDLKKQFGVTRRRAELIARDQNQKATAAITRARYLDMGIARAVWVHSAGGHKKRPTHVANSGKQFDVAEGWFDPDPKVRRHIHPGELINCKCVCRPVLPGFS